MTDAESTTDRMSPVHEITRRVSSLAFWHLILSFTTLAWFLTGLHVDVNRAVLTPVVTLIAEGLWGRASLLGRFRGDAGNTDDITLWLSIMGNSLVTAVLWYGLLAVIYPPARRTGTFRERDRAYDRLFRVAVVAYSVLLAIAATVIRGSYDASDAVRHTITLGLIVLVWRREPIGTVLFGVCAVLGGLYAIGAASHTGEPFHWFFGIGALLLGLIATCVPAPDTPKAP